MDRPDAPQVREWLTGNDGAPLFDFSRFGYGPPPDGQPDRLAGVVEQAVAYVEGTTARKLDGTLTDPTLVALAQDATAMRVQQVLVGRGNQSAVRDAIQMADVSSLRAGDFSVTRVTGNLNRGGLRALEVNPWRELSDVLLLLATPEKRAQLLAELTGQSVPAALTVEPGGFVSWEGSSYLGELW